MAKRDILLRFAMIENDYLEMKSLLDELNGDIKNGRIDAEYYNEKAPLIEQEIETIKLQYFFWSEAIFELNKPNRKSKTLDSTTQSWYDSLQTATKECLKDTSKNALETLKQILKEIKLNEM